MVLNKVKDIITIAVSKGYLWDEALLLFKKMGFDFEDDLKKSRKLFTLDKTKKIGLLMVRPWDVPVYVEEGAADLGIVGKDVLIEQEPNIHEIMDLKFGKCELVLAGLPKLDPNNLPHNLNVATKYLHSTQIYFRKKGLKINPIKMYGAIELAPLTGLSDVICDLSATGKTIKENKLEIIDIVFKSTARLIANPVKMKVKYAEILELSKKIDVKL